MVPRRRELDCGCVSGVLRVGWRDPEGPAHGWETDGTEGGQWAIKTFQYPYACEVLSPFPFFLWPFHFFSPQGCPLAEILPLEAQAVGGVESICLEEKDGNSLSLSPLVPSLSLVSRTGIFWRSWCMENSKPSQHFRVVCKTLKYPLWVLPFPLLVFCWKC